MALAGLVADGLPAAVDSLFYLLHGAASQ